EPAVLHIKDIIPARTLQAITVLRIVQIRTEPRVRFQFVVRDVVEFLQQPRVAAPLRRNIDFASYQQPGLHLSYWRSPGEATVGTAQTTPQSIPLIKFGVIVGHGQTGAEE